MKTLSFLLLFTMSCIGFAQNNHIVKTEDGRRVLLKADFTWEYIDLVKPEPTSDNNLKPKESKNCGLTEDFVEPKLNMKIQGQLKRGKATIHHIKKKVAKDYNCTLDDVVLLSFSEHKAKGEYHFCAKGIKVAYKRIGNSIVKKNKFF
ncbi:DUF3157 domain-containing protein [Flavivirga eckloniae]|uniref:DUF3157 domain-containing protein n=2 Tax=Flavivirga eckloniae TaxID=1803846 RepID=A0A2K9PQ44_9FLAO|nr:DUF3157 domain-containing protein [Flavivirga eckloniae]